MRNLILTFLTFFIVVSGLAYANNACETAALHASANVKTSNGASYSVEAYFRNRHESTVRFIDDSDSLLVIEGPLTWNRRNGEEQEAGAAERRFVIGHQFHALAFHFEEIVADAKPVKNIRFGQKAHDGSRGAYPDGGTATLLRDENGNAAGLILALPDTTEITVAFDDWRSLPSGVSAPFQATITHDGVIYDYQYTSVSYETGDAISFHEAFPAPVDDAVQVYRLHRSLLAAHCRGNAALMAELTTPEAIIANRGEITRVSPDDMGARFGSVFSSLDYRAYTDLKPPHVTVSQSGDLGWAIVNVRSEGEVIGSGEAFSDQWAWAMLAKKIDGVWLHAGNASNAKMD